MNGPARRRMLRGALAWTFAAPALGLLAATATVHAQGAGRQVTLFGIMATPGQAEDDPKLKEMIPQLRRLLPGHSFRLIKVESKNIATGGTVTCDLGDGFVASSQLLDPLDANGKIQFRFGLEVGGLPQLQTVVSTPPNQIVFINRMFPNGNRLVMGIGAR